MLAFAGPQDGDALPPNITMTRDERQAPTDPAGETFAAYVQRQGHVLEANLPGFQARSSDAANMALAPATSAT